MTWFNTVKSLVSKLYAITKEMAEDCIYENEGGYLVPWPFSKLLLFSMQFKYGGVINHHNALLITYYYAYGKRLDL